MVSVSGLLLIITLRGGVQIDFDEVTALANSDKGNELQFQYAQQTGQLVPAHNYVPLSTCVEFPRTSVNQEEAVVPLSNFIHETLLLRP